MLKQPVYDCSFKLMAVRHAKENNNCMTFGKYNSWTQYMVLGERQIMIIV